MTIITARTTVGSYCLGERTVTDSTTPDSRTLQHNRMVLAASEEDLLKAAEAVVDAALWCHSRRSSFQVTEEARCMLISRVFHNPALTGHLFNEDSLRLLCQS